MNTGHEENKIRGKEAFKNKEFNKAIKIFQHLISEGFENPEVLNLLGHSYMYTNNFHEAESIFQMLHENYTGTMLGIRGLASLKLNQNLPDECLDMIADAMKENPHDHGLKSIQIHALFKKKSYRDVIEWSEKTFTIYKEKKIPPPAIVLHCAGQSYEMCGEPVKARKTFEYLIQQHPKHHLGYVDIAKFYENTGMYHNALQAWRHAYDLLPKNIEIINQYTSLLIQFGDLKESTAILESSNSIVCRNFALCKRLIYNQILRHDWQGLVDCVKSIIAGNFENNPTSLLNFLIDNLPDHKALDHFKSVWVDDMERSDEALLSYYQAVIHNCEGQFAKALVNINQYFKTENGILNDINALQLKYNILINLEDVHAADQSYEEYLKEKNIHYKIFFDRAIQYRRRSAPELTISNIEKAHLIAPDDPGVIHNQFIIYYYSAGTKKALDFLQTHSHKTQKLTGLYLQELIHQDEFPRALERMDKEEKNSNLTWKIIYEVFSYCKAKGAFGNAVTFLNTFYKKPVLSLEDLAFKVGMTQEARHVKSMLQYKTRVHFTSEIMNKRVRKDIFRSLKNILNDEEIYLKPQSTNPIPFLNHIIEGKLSEEFVHEYFKAFNELSTHCNRFYPDTYTNIRSAFHLAFTLRKRIKERIPTIFMSLGVEDGIFFDHMTRKKTGHHHITFQSKEDQESSEESLFQQNLDTVSHAYINALETADIFGFPHWSSVLMAISDFKDATTFNDNVGLLNIYRNIHTLLQNGRLKKWSILTNSELISHFNYYQLLPYILDSVEKCYVISSKPEIVDHLKLNLNIPEVEWVEVPEKCMSPKSQFDSENIEFHIGILENLEQITHQNKGVIFLISAGIRGKIYCQKIKESGSIALEIGSLADFWSGVEKTYRYEHPVPPLGVNFSHPDVSKPRLNLKLFSLDFWKRQDIKTFEKQNIQKIYFFIKYSSVAFTTVRNDKRFAEWEYQTFFLVYNSLMPGTIEYQVVSSSNTYHKILPAHQNIEGGTQLKFYAYPQKQTESHIQKLRFSFVPYGKQISIEEIIPSPLYPACEVTHLKEITLHENRAFKIQKNRPVISIVMAYKNRKTQLAFTLSTIESSHYPKDQFEVIIADDGSHESECILSLIENFSIPIVLMRIADKYKKEKNYINSCIPYNKAFKIARGESIIIQNPEVCHMGDVLSYVDQNINENEFLSFTCTQNHTSSLNDIVQNLYGKDSHLKEKSVRQFIAQQAIKLKNSSFLWYNHPIFRAESFHFLCAIHKNNLDKLEGFREEFAFGIGVDDFEFTFRIKYKLYLKVRFTNWKSEPFGIHQWHPFTVPQHQAHKHLLTRNFRLFSSLTSQRVIQMQSFSMKSDAHKLVVYTNPKAGITTVRSWFLVLLGKYTFDEVMDINPHEFNWFAYEDDHPSSTSDYEKILVFREPKDRFISMYTSLFVIDYYEKHIFKRTKQKVDSIAHLIELLSEEFSTGEYNLLNDKHIAPQFMVLPNVSFDKIYTTDQMQQFLEHANVKYNTNFQYTTKRNESNSIDRSKVEQEFKKLSNDQLEKFERIYKNDLAFYELIKK